MHALRADFASRRADAADAAARAPGASHIAGSPVPALTRRRTEEQMGLACALLDLMDEWEQNVQSLRAQFEERRMALCSVEGDRAAGPGTLRKGSTDSGSQFFSPRTEAARRGVHRGESGAWF